MSSEKFSNLIIAITKAATCPPSQSDQNDLNWLLCDGHFYDIDGDCQCKQKCCHNMCGSSVCVSPDKKIYNKN